MGQKQTDDVSQSPSYATDVKLSDSKPISTSQIIAKKRAHSRDITARRQKLLCSDMKMRKNASLKMGPNIRSGKSFGSARVKLAKKQGNRNVVQKNNIVKTTDLYTIRKNRNTYKVSRTLPLEPP